MFEKIEKLPLKYFDNNLTGETVSKIINDTDAVSEANSSLFRAIIYGDCHYCRDIDIYACFKSGNRSDSYFSYSVIFFSWLNIYRLILILCIKNKRR